MPRFSNGSLPDRPMSVEEIVKAAGEQQVESRYSMTLYFRSASLLVKQANIYEHEGNDQMAYLLLYRHANLILGELMKHPHAKDPDYKMSWIEARRDVNRSLSKLEVLKPRIAKAYSNYQERQKARAAREAAAAKAQQNGQTQKRLDDDLGRMSLDSYERDHSPVRLDPVQHREEAVALANRTIRRNVYRPRGTDSDSQDITADLMQARKQIDQNYAQRPSPTRDTSTGRNVLTKQQYNYPSISSNHRPGSNGDRQLPAFSSIRNQPQSQPQTQSLPPTRPPKEYFHPISPYDSTTSPPPLPTKQPILYQQNNHFQHHPIASSDQTLPPLPSKTPILAPTSGPPPTKKAIQTFRTTSTLESGNPLRTLFLPPTLQQTFLTLAARNTTLKLETCGILIGTLLRNAFFITHLLLPAQNCTSDTCEMRDETQLYQFIEDHEQAAAAAASDEGGGEGGGDQLMVLGWIHTHPTQTCFLSSADLHTHMAYQLSLPESIAIVCSPSQPRGQDFGVFRLTDPPGLGIIKACAKPGIFHPHEVPLGGGGLFTDALRSSGSGSGGGEWGHVVLAEGLKFEVVDLRD